MSYLNKLTSLPLAAIVAATLILPAAAQAGTLENLERERSIALEALLNADLQTKERQAKVEGSKLRLIDLERMVLRDKSLSGRNTPTVRKAFENYDLTFLVHASAEKNLSLLDNWLGQLGVTTQSLMSANIRQR